MLGHTMVRQIALTFFCHADCSDSFWKLILNKLCMSNPLAIIFIMHLVWITSPDPYYFPLVHCLVMHNALMLFAIQTEQDIYIYMHVESFSKHMHCVCGQDYID